MLDETDKALIQALLSNARAPLADIAKRLNVARTTLSERLEKLERTGFIKGYRVEVNHYKLGFKYIAFVLVKVRRGGFRGDKSNQETLAEKIIQDCSTKRALPWIEEAHIITGEYDLLLKVWAREWEELTNFLVKYMPEQNDVVQTHTMLVLKTVHDDPRPPV
ncbi:MAG: Lrp/AsnC family transcriptional regulator [Thermofilaceae archaeon]|nr:Lrp/AsnC family transcriptional regulator [Thermofilaceae archaeon]MCX8180195.1 Lrp/AsnC family transcriptional regulator [Thermofilaceae archaeon]MDW8004149.1 Lrp/AsnC family transcriptional regulator [Thermofilaceae archaeon]